MYGGGGDGNEASTSGAQQDKDPKMDFNVTL